jgi:hypothetical protein
MLSRLAPREEMVSKIEQVVFGGLHVCVQIHPFHNSRIIVNKNQAISLVLCA